MKNIYQVLADILINYRKVRLLPVNLVLLLAVCMIEGGDLRHQALRILKSL